MAKLGIGYTRKNIFGYPQFDVSETTTITMERIDKVWNKLKTSKIPADTVLYINDVYSMYYNCLDDMSNRVITLQDMSVPNVTEYHAMKLKDARRWLVQIYASEIEM